MIQLFSSCRLCRHCRSAWHVRWSSQVFSLFLIISIVRPPTRAVVKGFTLLPTAAGPPRSLQTASTRTLMVATRPGEGLSKYYQSILSRTNDRQRFVTGRYPVIVSVEENPTRKWLGLGRGENAATSHVMVNDTVIDRSLASYNRFQWLDDDEREELHNRYASVSLELLAEIHIVKPAYLNILSCDGAGSSTAALKKTDSGMIFNRWKRNIEVHDQLASIKWKAPSWDRLWVTGFSLASRKGSVKSVDIQNGRIESINTRSESMTLWPNEVAPVPSMVSRPVEKSTAKTEFEDALLVSDGFLVPGKDRGGVYLIKNPGNPNSEWTVCLTDSSRSDRWFYHRAVWADLTGDGRMSILTARAKLRKAAGSSGNPDTASRPKNGQLVWLEMPIPSLYDEATGTPLEEDGTAFDPFSSRHLPWTERVLATGPDVMFSIADLNTEDETFEVLASQFFDKTVTLYSVRRGPNPKVTFSRVIDNRCGAAFGGILADLECDGRTNKRIVVDSGSTIETLKPGESFSHLLVTSHECKYDESENRNALVEIDPTYQISSPGNTGSLDGGSLFAYRVPEGNDAWKTEKWERTTVATGFKVHGQLWNVINPGAPGFVYTFHAKKDDASIRKRPMIAVAGDCAESAYIFRPEEVDFDNETAESFDQYAQYALMCEIKCGATVGSLGIGYRDLCSAEQETGYAKIYIPCYEKDKVLVFAMGSGEYDSDEYDAEYGL